MRNNYAYLQFLINKKSKKRLKSRSVYDYSRSFFIMFFNHYFHFRDFLCCQFCARDLIAIILPPVNKAVNNAAIGVGDLGFNSQDGQIVQSPRLQWFFGNVLPRR